MDQKQVRVSASLVPSGCLAFVLSYALNHSILWAMLNGIFGWLYIVYAVIARGHEILPALGRLFS